jgi:O-antigen ligase
MLFLGVTLMVRVLTDDLASPDSRQSGSIDLSGVIAVLFIFMAAGLVLVRRRGMLPTILAVIWLCIWTAVAVSTRGASTETLREGVRELSVVALAVIVYNACRGVTVTTATRLVQLIGITPAILALYQLATHTGLDIAGNVRSNGTFAHPNSAAMFFAIAAAVCIWRYLDDGRHRSDVLLAAIFAAALIATFSIDGVATLVAMLIALGLFRRGSLRAKLVPCMAGVLVILAFFATPLGARRISHESTTSFATAEGGEPNTSLAWRLHKWKTLIPEWERSPIFGQGLGTTTTGRAIPGNRFSSKPPHNEYVRYLVETGLAGFITLSLALVLLVRNLLRRRRLRDTLGARAHSASTLALVTVVGCLVNSLADNTLLDSPTCYAAALLIAAVLGFPGDRDNADNKSAGSRSRTADIREAFRERAAVERA